MTEKLQNFVRWIKEKINNKFSKFKSKVLNLPFTINSIFDYMLRHHIISTEIDDIPIKHLNKKSCKYCWFNYFYSIFSSTLYIIFLLKFQWMFSLPNLPSKLSVLIMMIDSFTWFIVMIRRDFLIADMENNLNGFKSFYYLKNNTNEIYKLNQSNYKRLSVLSFYLYILSVRIMPVVVFIGVMYTITNIWLITGSFIWFVMVLVESYTAYVVLNAIFCFVTVLVIPLTYYRMLFNQINFEINEVVKSKRRKSIIRLFKMIQKHHMISIEIDQLNKSFRRTIGSLFMIVSVAQMFLLYMMLKVNELYVKFTVILIFIAWSYLCLQLCTLLSLQINAAHRSYKTIFSVLNKPNLSYRMRWKVSNSNLKIVFSINFHLIFSCKTL